MTQDTSTKSMSLKSCIAVIICFAAVYLSEITLGAVATLPFILVLPGIAYIIYRKKKFISVICAVCAFLVKCIFSSNPAEVVGFALFCTLLASVSCGMFEIFTSSMNDCINAAKKAVPLVAFISSVVIYIFFYGTIFGNLSSKEENIRYLKETYPNENFLIGNTYYSFTDRKYVTEFDFTANERYTAFVNASERTSEGYAKIDGFRDYIKYDLLNIGKNDIRSALSTFVYEGTDYVIRNRDISTSDMLTAASTYNEYSDKASYEIALYNVFDSAKSFEDACKGYINHLSKFESLRFGNIIFYGFDNSGSNDFAYSLNYSFGSGEIKSSEFNRSDYSRYFKEKDTHKYWELIG